MRSGDATKSRIQKSALMLFVDNGVDGTGMREIAKAAGITEGAIYRHFKGKDELVWALFADSYQAYGEKLDALQRGAVHTAAKLEAMVRGFCTFYDEDETLFRFLLLVQHGQLLKVTDAMRTPVDVVMDVISDGIRAGHITYKDASAATAAVLGIVLQTATFKIYDRLPGPMHARADALVAACQGAVGMKVSRKP